MKGDEMICQPPKSHKLVTPKIGGLVENNNCEAKVRLDNIEHFFSKPQISPLSDEYYAYSYTSGIEYIADELFANTSYRTVRITIQLPIEDIQPELTSKVKSAVRRYCRGRLKDIEHEINALRWRGIRALAAAITVFITFFIAANWIYNQENLLRQLISEGLSVAGWVAIWFPLQLLTFEAWQHRLDKKIYTLLYDMELTIEPAD